MITQGEWQSLLHLQPSHFRYPNNMEIDVVRGLDILIGAIGVRPIILSDYRPGDKKQHGKGRAIDTTWPGAEPMAVWDKAHKSRLFSGLGIYTNEGGYVSFHFDTRTERTVDRPATWGGQITHPFDPEVNGHIKRTEYTTVDAVIDQIKKKGTTVIAVLASLSFAIYLITRNSD